MFSSWEWSPKGDQVCLWKWRQGKRDGSWEGSGEDSARQLSEGNEVKLTTRSQKWQLKEIHWEPVLLVKGTVHTLHSQFIYLQAWASGPSSWDCWRSSWVFPSPTKGSRSRWDLKATLKAWKSLDTRGGSRSASWKKRKVIWKTGKHFFFWNIQLINGLPISWEQGCFYNPSKSQVFGFFFKFSSLTYSESKI